MFADSLTARLLLCGAVAEGDSMIRILLATMMTVALAGSAAADQQMILELRCNSAQHGVIRGGPWAKVGGPFYTIRDCDGAKPGHRNGAHGGDTSVVLQCSRIQ